MLIAMEVRSGAEGALDGGQVPAGGGVRGGRLEIRRRRYAAADLESSGAQAEVAAGAMDSATYEGRVR